jgi:hypothetical protein
MREVWRVPIRRELYPVRKPLTNVMASAHRWIRRRAQSGRKLSLGWHRPIRHHDEVSRAPIALPCDPRGKLRGKLVLVGFIPTMDKSTSSVPILVDSLSLRCRHSKAVGNSGGEQVA